MRRISSPSPSPHPVGRAWCVGLAVLAAAAATLIAAPAHGENVPNWELELRVAQWVAPSSFAATIVSQSAGLKVRIGHPVTLILDRRTTCSRAVAGGTAAWIPCRTLRARVAAQPSLLVAVGGQFETGHLGRIGFRARRVLVKD